jgi:hypothetical protein
MLKLVLEKWDGGMDRSDVTEDRDSLWAVVNAVMNILVPVR